MSEILIEDGLDLRYVCGPSLTSIRRAKASLFHEVPSPFAVLIADETACSESISISFAMRGCRQAVTLRSGEYTKWERINDQRAFSRRYRDKILKHVCGQNIFSHMHT